MEDFASASRFISKYFVITGGCKFCRFVIFFLVITSKIIASNYT